MITFHDGQLAAAPPAVRALLWDLDPAVIRLDRQDLIIPRLLIADDPEVLRWLRNAIGDQSIRAWIITNRGGGLDALDLHPWVVMFGIEQDAVDWHVEAALSYASTRNEARK